MKFVKYFCNDFKYLHAPMWKRRGVKKLHISQRELSTWFYYIFYTHLWECENVKFFLYYIYFIYIIYIIYYSDSCQFYVPKSNNLQLIKKTSHFHILSYLLYKLLFLLHFILCEVQNCISQLLNYNFGRIPWNITFYSIKLYTKISDELRHELEHWLQLTWHMRFVGLWSAG